MVETSMLELCWSVLEARKEMLVGATLLLVYVSYYLLNAVKVPEVVCSGGALQALLQSLPVLQQHYWPTPWCVEGRAQTVLGSLLRTHWLGPVRWRGELLTLADGGTLALHWAEEAPAPAAPRAVLVLLPGLTGGPSADYACCAAAAARRLGAACVLVNHRGMGGAPLTTPRLYSAVSHSDVSEALAAVARAVGPAVPLLGVGVSLGGLILGQYLAHAGERSLLAAALTLSAPLDVIKGMQCMEGSRMNWPLSWHCARGLRRVVAAHAHALQAAADWGGLARARSVRAFDAAFTARHFGFDSVEAYYRAATLRGKLRHVAVPLLCVCAHDDPFQPGGVLPRGEVCAGGRGRVALVVTARGGHIGWLEGWRPARPAPQQYMTRLMHQYFHALLQRPDLLHSPPPPPAAPAPAPAH